jgi:hypothetical protein
MATTAKRQKAMDTNAKQQKAAHEQAVLSVIRNSSYSTDKKLLLIKHLLTGDQLANSTAPDDGTDLQEEDDSDMGESAAGGNGPATPGDNGPLSESRLLESAGANTRRDSVFDRAANAKAFSQSIRGRAK